jgi:hypothetical protein
LSAEGQGRRLPFSSPGRRRIRQRAYGSWQLRRASGSWARKPRRFSADLSTGILLLGQLDGPAFTVQIGEGEVGGRVRPLPERLGG